MVVEIPTVDCLESSGVVAGALGVIIKTGDLPALRLNDPLTVLTLTFHRQAFSRVVLTYAEKRTARMGCSDLLIRI